jgi:hypothetical protein
MVSTQTEQVVARSQIRQAAVASKPSITSDFYTQSQQHRSWDRFLARERHFFPKAHRLALGLSQSIYWVYRGYVPGGKATGAPS